MRLDACFPLLDERLTKSELIFFCQLSHLTFSIVQYFLLKPVEYVQVVPFLLFKHCVTLVLDRITESAAVYSRLKIILWHE